MTSINQLKVEQGQQWVTRANAVKELQLLSVLTPGAPIRVKEYRIAGGQIEPILRHHLEECKRQARPGIEAAKKFRRLTSTLRYSLAGEIGMAWCEVPRYLPKDDAFSDIVIKILPALQSDLDERIIERRVIGWLREDLAKECKSVLIEQAGKWRESGLLTVREYELRGPAAEALVPYAQDGGYYTAASLHGALLLARDPGFKALMSPLVAAEGGCPPVPAVRINGSIVELIGVPERRNSARWVSNVVQVRSRSEIGYPGLTVDLSLHSRVYGTLASSPDNSQGRQLMVFSGIRSESLVMRQYPFIYDKDGATFSDRNKPDLAGETIERFFNVHAAGLQGGIPTDVTVLDRDQMMACPLLASGLSDKQVVLYSGATSTERFDVLAVAQSVLSESGYKVMPPMRNLDNVLPNKRQGVGVVAFHDGELYADSKRGMQARLRQALENQGGGIKVAILYRDHQAREYLGAIKELEGAMAKWTGCGIKARYTVDGKLCAAQGTVKYPQRYGHGSWQTFSQGDLTGCYEVHKATKSTRSLAGTTGDPELFWWWVCEIRLGEESVITDLGTIELNEVDRLGEMLDGKLGLPPMERRLYRARRELLARQCGRHITLPVFGGRPELREALREELYELLGRPHQTQTPPDGNGERLVYTTVDGEVELEIHLLMWPEHESSLKEWESLALPLEHQSGKDYRATISKRGRTRQQQWLRALCTFIPATRETHVLPVIFLPQQDKRIEGTLRDLKPWLRDLFNGIGWVAKFINYYPKGERLTKEERIKIKATLRGQLTNHGVAPMQLKDLTRDNFALGNGDLSIAALTVIKAGSSPIPVVWRTWQGVSTIGLFDREVGVRWYRPWEAVALLSRRDVKANEFDLGKFAERQDNGSLFLARVVRDLDRQPGVLLINGVAARSAIPALANKDFMFDRIKLTQTAVIRVNSEDGMCQYYPVDETHSKAGTARPAGFLGLYAYPGDSRRCLNLIQKPPQAEGYARHKAENRFVDLEQVITPLVDLEPREVGKIKNGGEVVEGKVGAKMMRLSEIVLTDLPEPLRKDVLAQQSLHNLVQKLVSVHLEKEMSYIMPYPLHEVTDLVTDMTKILQVDGLGRSGEAVNYVMKFMNQ